MERYSLVAPCGIDCGVCELHTCKDNPQLYDALIGRGFSKDRIPCPGCRGTKGNCPVIPETCATYICAGEKKIEFCYECGEFPCDYLQPASDRAAVLPHNIKVFNLCTIKNKGMDAFLNLSSEIKLKYYKGVMEVGKGPKMT